MLVDFECYPPCGSDSCDPRSAFCILELISWAMVCCKMNFGKEDGNMQESEQLPWISF